LPQARLLRSLARCLQSLVLESTESSCGMPHSCGEAHGRVAMDAAGINKPEISNETRPDRPATST
jgi:hypothetical protein